MPPKLQEKSPVGRDTLLPPSFFLDQKDGRSMRQTVIYVEGKRYI